MSKRRKLTTVESAERMKISKEEIAQRKAEEAKLNDFDKLEGDPPDELDAMAKNEWNRIIPLLKDLPVAELDMSMVENYCVLYSQMKHTNKDMKRYRKEMDKDDDAYAKYNKAFNNYMKISSELRSTCNNLGMTIDSRLKIVVPTQEEKADPILEVLNS